MIRLQFATEAAWSSAAIRWFSAGAYSHVDCVLDSGDLLGARYDAVGGKPPGVWARPPGYARFSRTALMEIPCTEAQKKAYHGFLLDQVGKPYDGRAIWAFLFDRDWRDDDSWDCSELQSRAGEVSEVLSELFVPTSKVTPVACGVAFSARGGRVVVTTGDDNGPSLC